MKLQLLLAILFLFIGAFMCNAQWETETLPDGRSEIASVVIDDNIYFVGGALSGVNRYHKMNIYNVPSKSWTTVDVPNGTKGPRTVAIDKKIYFGDIEGDRTIYVYNSETEIWEDSISVPGYIGTLTTMDNLIIIEDSGDLLIYDLDTEEWTEFDMDYNPNATVAAANGKIALAGGSPNVVQIYDVQSGAWEESELSLERDEPRAASYGTKMFFIGGEGDSFAWVPRIDIYDTDTDTWSIDSISTDRNRFDVTVYDDKLIIAGGQTYSFSNQWSDEIDIFDFTSNSWDTLYMPTGRRYPAVVGHDDLLYIAGGDDDDDNLDVVEIFNLTPSNTENFEELNIKVYPNPVDNHFVIDTDHKVSHIEIVNLQGRILHEYASRDGNLNEVNVSHLEAGIYFIRFNQTSQLIKFIKN